MGRLADVKISGSNRADRELVRALFGDVEIQEERPGYPIKEATIKRVTNWYGDSTGEAPLFLFVPKVQNIARIWPPYDLSPYATIRYGTTFRIKVHGLYLSLKENRVGIYILTKPEAIGLEDNDSFGI